MTFCSLQPVCTVCPGQYAVRLSFFLFFLKQKINRFFFIIEWDASSFGRTFSFKECLGIVLQQEFDRNISADSESKFFFLCWEGGLKKKWNRKRKFFFTSGIWVGWIIQKKKKIAKQCFHYQTVTNNTHTLKKKNVVYFVVTFSLHFCVWLLFKCRPLSLTI